MAKELRGIQRRHRPQPRSGGEGNIDAFVGGAKGDQDALEDALAALSPAEPEPERERTRTFNLRLPQSLHAKLEAVAAATGKSMHEVAMTLLMPALEKAHERYVD